MHFVAHITFINEQGKQTKQKTFLEPCLEGQYYYIQKDFLKKIDVLWTIRKEAYELDKFA